MENMDDQKTKRNLSPSDGPESCFWESEMYFKQYFKSRRSRKFNYYDSACPLKPLFFHWVTKWVKALCRQYIEPYKLHPVFVSDQVLRWEPIFSKHVSDGLVNLDLHHTPGNKERVRAYSSVLFRAIILTGWKRLLFLIIGLIATNVLSMSISIFVRRLLEYLNDKSVSVVKTILMLSAIIGFQVLDGLVLENLNFYLFRLIYVFHYLYSIVAFRHAISHRRQYFNHVNGANALGACNELIHSCAPEAQCARNPLFCPALRHKTGEMSPKVFTYTFYDSFYIAMFFESFKYFLEFLSNFIYGVYLLSKQAKVNMWILYLTGGLFFLVMVLLEILNACVFRFVLYIRDAKVTKYNDIFWSLSNIKKMFLDDIGTNIITQTRNKELSLSAINSLLTFFNMCLYSSCINLSFYMIKRYFVKSINEATVVTDIDTAGFMVTFYIFLRIITSMFLIPRAIKVAGMSYVAYKRLNSYLKKCPPNFYISDNKFTGSTNAALIVTDATNKLPNEAVVYFKAASFAWVHSRKDLFNKNYDVFLRNVNFELMRGEIAIVSGPKGAGKSNFIKSILGEMTLVGGSMAVVPLHTSMPIFYASQDIWMPCGTIRSIITFGYRFDEQIYNTVLKAVELQSDISTWENGDKRMVSDNAPSLSGGQRVRMELARAVYAYLVFHKVNREYNEGKCSFLMCLDSPFHGLDPQVSKTIFNNLFNLKDGLLVKKDLCVVLASSNQTLEACSKFSDPSLFPNPPIYEVKDRQLVFYVMLHDFIRNKRHSGGEFEYLSASAQGLYKLHSFTEDMHALCCSGETTREGRVEPTKQKYAKSFKTFIRDDLAGAKFSRYFVYMMPALSTFIMYIVLTVGLSALDYIKLVFSTRLTDHINSKITEYNDGNFVDLADIRTRSDSSLNLTLIFVLVIILLSLMAMVCITTASVVSCRKIHEYCINSVFKNSSHVIKIKKQISRVLTYFSGDLIMVDDIMGLFIALLLFSFIQTITNIITLFYVIPISVPFVVVTLTFVYFFILKRYVDSTRSMNYGFLETLQHTYTVLETSISGSAIYRTFKRDFDLFAEYLQERDYNSRTKFLMAGIVSWSTVLFNWAFSLNTLLILVIPILLDKFTKYKLVPGYYGLALSLCMNVIKSFSIFSLSYSCTEMLMASIERLQYFIPPGEKPKFAPFLNTHDEYVVNPVNKDKLTFDTRQLLQRRRLEFKANTTKFYLFRRLFFRPKINFVPAERYMAAEHTGVELKDVCAYTTPELSPNGLLLKNVTASATKSDIIGMVGRTGAGKTTLLSVLQHIVTNRTGSVTLDGTDLNDIPKIVLRQIIGVLPQLPFVFKGWTIRRFIDPRKLFTDDEINTALSKCGLLNFVNDLPGGRKLDTVISKEDPLLYHLEPKHRKQAVPPKNLEKSETMPTDLASPLVVNDVLLSNTQLRTLAVTRLVLYRHFYRMIIVDEPPEEDVFDETASTTAEVGVSIYDLLKKYFSHCTTFVTAHEATVLKNCTAVWVLHEGRLVKKCKSSDVSRFQSMSELIGDVN